MTQVLGHEWVTPVGRAIGWPSSYRSPGKSFTVPFTTVCSDRYLLLHVAWDNSRLAG